MGNLGLGHVYENKGWFAEPCVITGLVTHKDIHKVRRSLQDVKTTERASATSDHHLVVASDERHAHCTTQEHGNT